MPAHRSQQTLRQLLDVRSAELRHAGKEVSPGPLARRLIEAKGLNPEVAMQLASDYLAGEAEATSVAGATNRLLPRGHRNWLSVLACILIRHHRIWLSLLAWAAIGALVWCGGSGLGWEPPLWFVALILGLAGMNLLVWVLEPLGWVGKLDCARCGAPRRPHARKECPVCGAQDLKLPRVSRVALWAVALFFGGWGAFFVYGALRDPPNRVQHLLESLGWLIVSAAVVLRACGFRVDRVFRRFVDLKIDKDFDRMARHPYLAIQVLLLIASLVGLFFAIVALLGS